MLRVDNIPWYLKPPFWLWGYTAGWLLYGWTKAIHLTCRIKFTGAALPYSGPPVAYCIWHKDLALYFSVFNKVSGQAWLNHPAWYMKPIHVLLHLTGVEHICLGSSGNNGMAALEKVTGYLKQGCSTLVACDGPAGPAYKLKPGVLFMSRDAHIPVMPLRFSCSRGLQLGGWDKKWVPYFFSEITVTVGEAIQVSDNNLEQCEMEITAFLNATISGTE